MRFVDFNIANIKDEKKQKKALKKLLIAVLGFSILGAVWDIVTFIINLTK